MDRRALAVLVLTGGCNLVFGLEPPATARPPEIDASDAIDASESIDAPDVDAPPPPPPIDAPALPTDAPCVPIVDNNECTYDLCMNGVPVNPPVPRHEYCNGGADQCDGAGSCVDCTNSGGCGECCTCSINQTCVPA
jgi:hypothetical protein